MSVQKINAADFDQNVLNSPTAVLVDFYADWCGPCKMLSPIVDQIAEENPEVKVFKLDVDDASSIATQYGVMSIPTLIVFKNGEAVTRTVGVQNKQSILKMLSI